MADENESQDEDKTEDPSPRRLQQAFDDGNIATSRDAGGAAALLAAAAAVTALAPTFASSLVSAVRNGAQSIAEGRALFINDALRVGGATALVVAVVAAAAVASMLAQTRGGVWSKHVAPDMSRLFSMERLTRIFSRQGLADLGAGVAKALAILGAASLTLKEELTTLPRLFLSHESTWLAAFGHALADLMPRALGVAALVAAGDFLLQRSRFMKKLRMTKEELKREHKEDEGDPHIRGRRKRKHRELLKGAVAKEVPRADAIVVNPTHVAVAIRYRKGKDKAPRVIAKGKGATATRMRELALEHGIPIVRDIPLARLLYKRVRVGRAVPAETYRAVAAVLAFVYKATGRVPGTGPE